jgi:hypothetical protein
MPRRPPAGHARNDRLPVVNITIHAPLPSYRKGPATHLFRTGNYRLDKRVYYGTRRRFDNAIS